MKLEGSAKYFDCGDVDVSKLTLEEYKALPKKQTGEAKNVILDSFATDQITAIFNLATHLDLGHSFRNTSDASAVIPIEPENSADTQLQATTLIGTSGMTAQIFSPAITFKERSNSNKTVLLIIAFGNDAPRVTYNEMGVRLSGGTPSGLISRIAPAEFIKTSNNASIEYEIRITNPVSS